MRAGCLVAVLVAGCSFDVIGTNVGDPNGTAPPSPAQSVPNEPDAGAPPTQTTPPATTPPPAPDMAHQRIGTACTTDAQCDPGLFCVKSFGLGPAKVDIPGGYCTHDCSSSSCPADSVCVTFNLGKYCESTCPPDPCRMGYVCCSVGSGQKACTPDQLCTDG